VCSEFVYVCVCVCVQCVCGGGGEGSEVSMVGIYAHSNTLYHVSRLLQRHLFLTVWREVTNCMNNIYIVHVYIFQYNIVLYTVGLDLLFIAFGPMIISIGK